MISGKTDKEHIKNVDSVLEVLEKIGATVNKAKYVFFANEIEYVGFIFDKASEKILKKIQLIIELPEQLQSFLRGINCNQNSSLIWLILLSHCASC